MEHITSLVLYLEPQEGFDMEKLDVYSVGPMLQSVLLSAADAAYAKRLHETGFNPYSQHCCKDGSGRLVWYINALNDEAVARLLEPARKIETFKLRNLNTSFAVLNQSFESQDISCLLEKLKSDVGPTFRICFATPTSFKSKGRYVIMPDVRLIFQNLLMRYNQVYAGSAEVDPETVEYIAEHTAITSYNLRSRYFPRTMGKQGKIPAFIGSITLHVNGPQSLRGLVAMLLSFGEVAGVGIKTAMGMGGMQLLQVERKSNYTKQGGSIGR